jgi:CheY-like chemotaxis protein
MENRTTDVANGHSRNHHGPLLRVLVVEEPEDTASSLAMLLRVSRYEIEVAADGPAALRAVQAKPPDVVLLDLGVANLEGWRLAKQIKEQSKARRPFLIAVTSYGPLADPEYSQESGIDLQLVKPVDPVALEQILRRFQTVVAPGAEQ